MMSRIAYWFRLWRYDIHEIEKDRYVLSKRTLFGREYRDLRSNFWWPKRSNQFSDCVSDGVTVLRAYHFAVGTPSSNTGHIISATALATKLKLKGQS